jgi:hypothetical protein
MAGLAVTSADRAAFCPEMRKLLLAAILVAATACGAYHFPGTGDGSGTVSGKVTAYPCGPVEPAAGACMPGSTTDCLPKNPNDGSSCGPWPMPGVALTFKNGTTSVGAKTTSEGFYSVHLPAGTWSVSAGGFMRIISGPLTVVVESGSDITANYVIDTGIRAAS